MLLLLDGIQPADGTCIAAVPSRENGSLVLKGDLGDKSPGYRGLGSGVISIIADKVGEASREGDRELAKS